ncbi:hypothetical protein ACHAPU_010137 [Fusarium lateritium]
MEPHDTVEQATIKVRMQDINPLTASDVLLIHSAASIISHSCVEQGYGLCEIEVEILLVHAQHTEDQYETLGAFAQEVCSKRTGGDGDSDVRFTPADKRLLREYRVLIASKRRAAGCIGDAFLLGQKRLVVDALADEDPSEVSTGGSTVTSLASSAHSRSSLSALLQLPGISDFITSGTLSNVHPATRNALANHVQRNPSRYGMYERLPELPTLPSFAEIGNASMPNTLEDVQREIDRGLEDETVVSLWLVRNRGLLWRLKMRKGSFQRRVV